MKVRKGERGRGGEEESGEAEGEKEEEVGVEEKG